jgi:hypothetical protein
MIHQMMNEPDSLFDFDFTTGEQGIVPKKPHITVRNFNDWLKHDLKMSEKSIPAMIE